MKNIIQKIKDFIKQKNDFKILTNSMTVEERYASCFEQC